MKTGRRKFLQLVSMGTISTLIGSKIVGKSKGFDIIELVHKPCNQKTMGIVGQWVDVSKRYPLLSDQYPPIFEDGDTILHYDYNNPNGKRFRESN